MQVPAHNTISPILDILLHVRGKVPVRLLLQHGLRRFNMQDTNMPIRDGWDCKRVADTA